MRLCPDYGEGKRDSRELIRKKAFVVCGNSALKEILVKENIIVLHDFNGNPLEDIRGADQNQAVGGPLDRDFIRRSRGTRPRASIARWPEAARPCPFIGLRLQLFGPPLGISSTMYW